MWLIGVLVSLLFTLKLAIALPATYDSRNQPWLKDINASIKINLRRSCKWKQVQGFGVPIDSSDTFYMTPLLPSKSEWQSLQALPISLTKSHPVLLETAHIANFYNDSFKDDFQAEMPSDHPAQNRRLCYNITRWASKGGILDLYQSFRTVERSSYLLRNRRGVIHPTGSVAFNCGYYLGQEGCETRWDGTQDKWYDGVYKDLTAAKLNWESPWDTDTTKKNLSVFLINNASQANMEEEYTSYNMSFRHLFTAEYHRRVYLLETQWDFNYHHFVADCLARLIHNIRFLRANTDVMIHIRASELYDPTDERRSTRFQAGVNVFRNRLFKLLGIDPSRVISGLVLADEVFMPRVLHCTYAISNPIEIRALTKELIQRSYAVLEGPVRQKALQAAKNPVRKNLVIQQRYTIYGSNDRFWHNNTLKAMVEEFTLLFPNHNIVPLSSLDASSPDYCLDCEIRMYQSADILVGNHGAGLTSAMFMPPGGLVVEIVGAFNNVNMPVCGYYGPWSSMFGLHHYLHAWKFKLDEVFSPSAVASQTLKFYEELRFKSREDLNVSSYSHSKKAVVDLERGVFG